MSDSANTPVQSAAEQVWIPEPREVPAELTPEYVHADYTPAAPTFFPTVADRLDEVMRNRLHELFGTLQ